ncbi:hypothetical protein ABW19_dt0201943 [Dactylella cylindrospora]|nr:hypothetical protein ABW19_dt0201943 [Dactylella cylindrospora]
MPPVTPKPKKLKSCLSSSSPSDCSSPANSVSSKATTATPPTPYSSGGSSGYSTPTQPRRHKKSVRFKAEAELTQVKHYKSASVTTTTKKKEEIIEVKKGKKRKEEDSEDSYYYHETTVSKIIESGPTGLGITIDGSYGPPTKAPPQAPLPRPTKRERTKYSQSPPTKSAEMKMTYSFDDSTSTSSYPDRSFGQAPPPPTLMQNSSFTEIASYPPVPQIMSTGFSFTEQPEETWWAYQEPQQPPMASAASTSRTLRRKRSFEARKTSESRHAPAPEIVDVDSMRSRRGSSKSSSSSSSTSSKLPTGSVSKESRLETSSRSSSSRRRRGEEQWEEQYRMETLKRQARQKTRDREVKKHTRTDLYGSFGPDAGAGYFDKGAAYSFNADEGYDRYF